MSIVDRAVPLLSLPSPSVSCAPRRAPLALLALLALVGLLAIPAASADAQTSYTVDPFESFFTTGCTGLSQCLCPVFLGESLDGSLQITPLFPSLGPIFEYAVDDVEITRIESGGAVTTYLGSGLLTVDLIANTQQMTLDLTVNGVPATFTSVGAVPLAGPVDEGISISVFAEVSTCIYDGLTIVGYPFIVDPPLFVRGDTNQDGDVNVADAISALLLLFGGVDGEPCQKAYDVNDDGERNIADPIALLAFLFSGGAPPPTPFGACGTDPTPDDLTCDSFEGCI